MVTDKCLDTLVCIGTYYQSSDLSVDIALVPQSDLRESRIVLGGELIIRVGTTISEVP